MRASDGRLRTCAVKGFKKTLDTQTNVGYTNRANDGAPRVGTLFGQDP
jgi:hypothetical protein